jgi:chromosome segregation ATPase
LYLIKKSKFDYENISPKDIFNIYNQDDTDSSFPIKISKIKEDDLVSKFEDNIAILDEKITHGISRIKDLNVKKNEKDLNIKNNKKQIKIYDDKFIELKMILDSLDDKLIKLKITLDSLIKNEKKLSETDEKNKDKIVDISSEKNKLKKERDDTLKIINLIEQNVAPFREKNKILFKEIESLILDIKNLTNDNRIDEQKNNEYKTSIKYLDINTIYKIDFKVFKKEDKNNKNPIQDVQIGTLIDELKHYNNLN